MKSRENSQRFMNHNGIEKILFIMSFTKRLSKIRFLTFSLGDLGCSHLVTCPEPLTKSGSVILSFTNLDVPQICSTP